MVGQHFISLWPGMTRLHSLHLGFCPDRPSVVAANLPSCRPGVVGLWGVMLGAKSVDSGLREHGIRIVSAGLLST